MYDMNQRTSITYFEYRNYLKENFVLFNRTFLRLNMENKTIKL